MTLILTNPPTGKEKPVTYTHLKKSELKKNLTKRTATLLSGGFNMMGNSEDAFIYIEEQLYLDEADSIYEFVLWVIKNHHRASREMPFIERNYPNLYKNYFLKEYQF